MFCRKYYPIIFYPTVQPFLTDGEESSPYEGGGQKRVVVVIEDSMAIL